MGNHVRAGSKYTDEDRRRAVLEYAISGNMAQVSRSTSIAESTLCNWRQSEWWGELLEEVRSEKEAIILANHEKIMELAHRELEDRLENGDHQLVRKGDNVELHRVPVKAKELAIIGGVSYDKRRLSLNLPTSITSDGRSQLEKFRRVVEQFKESLDEKRADSLPGTKLDRDGD